MKRLIIERLVLVLFILSFFAMVAWKTVIKISDVSGLGGELGSKLATANFDTALDARGQDLSDSANAVVIDTLTAFGISKDTIRTDSMQAYTFFKASVSDIDTGYGYDTLATAALGITGTIDINGEYISGGAMRDSGESVWNDSISLAGSYMSDSALAMIDSMTMGNIDTTGLVLYLSFDDSVTATGTIPDYSGYGNDAPNYTAESKKDYDSVAVGLGAISFGGTDSIIIDNVVADLSGTTTGTIMFWMAPDDVTPATSEVLFGYGDRNANESIYFQLNTSGYFVGTCGDVGVTQWTFTTSNVDVTANRWSHIALIQDGSYPVLYVDGDSVARTFSTTTDLTSWFHELTGVDIARLGCLKYNSGAGILMYSGLMDEYYQYKRALSAAELKNYVYNSAHYNVALTKADKEAMEDSLATKATFADISDSTQLFFAQVTRGDTNETAIATQSVPTLIGTKFVIADSSGFMTNADSTSIIFTGGQNALAQINLQMSLLETDGAATFSVFIRHNLDTLSSTEIDRKLTNNAIGALGTTCVATIADQDSFAVLLKNEDGTQNVTAIHIAWSFFARDFRK